MSDTATLIVKQTIQIEAYDDGRTPDDGLPPDRIVEDTLYYDYPSGVQITDPDRIAAIKAKEGINGIR